jgi:putative phosphotransacetylase
VVHQLNQTDKAEQDVPIGVSVRHAHLSQEHLNALFGSGYALTKKAELSQPGQFAANETVLIVGPKGSLDKVRILGPVRRATQVEVSRTDAVKLGYQPPFRESGDIAGSSPITILGPKGSIQLPEGLIIAQRHIHMTSQDAARYKVKNGEVVHVRTTGSRPVTFENVRIRVSERYKLEMHIDTDEANAAMLSTGDSGTLIPSSNLRYG